VTQALNTKRKRNVTTLVELKLNANFKKLL